MLDEYSLRTGEQTSSYCTVEKKSYICTLHLHPKRDYDGVREIERRWKGGSREEETWWARDGGNQKREGLGEKGRRAERESREEGSRNRSG